jgi:hypothetical protein
MKDLLEILNTLHLEGKNFCLQSRTEHNYYNLSIKYKKASIQQSSSNLEMIRDFARLHLNGETIREDDLEDLL